LKLTKLEITNFRCFESLTVPLHPEVNVFVGTNGSGKTAILDAIAIALFDIAAANGGGGKVQRGKQRASLRPSDIHIPQPGSEPAMSRKEFVQFRATAGNLYSVSGTLSAIMEGDEPELQWSDHIAFTPPAGFSYLSQKSFELLPLYDYFKALWDEARRTNSNALIPFPAVAYYRSSRRLADMPDLGDFMKESLDRPGAYRDALDASANHQAMCRWLYLSENEELRQIVAAGSTGNAVRTDLKAVREALLLMLEGAEKVYFQDRPPSLMVDLKQPNGSSQPMEIAQLSDGYRNLLAITLDFARRLAQANPGWENPLKAPGILLIDEVELHLHPKWQQEVLPNLRKAFPNTQVIVSTHSPQVVSTIARESIQVLVVHQNVPSLRIPGFQTRGVESADILARVMGVDPVPQVEEAQWLSDYRAMIETGKAESEDALQLRSRLVRHFGADHPVMLDCDRLLRFQGLKRRGPRAGEA